MTSPLRPLLTRLGGSIPLGLHEHVALFEHAGADAAWLTGFLAEGIERGEFCLVVGRRDFSDRLVEQLRARVGEVDPHVRSGRLRLHDAAEPARHGGRSRERGMREWTEQAFQDAERAQAPALRWLEEGAWPRETGVDLDEFFECHALLNYQVKHYPSVALCWYDLDRTEPPQLFRALAVHRHLIVEKTLVRDNPFYVPPEKFSPQERERSFLEVFREVGFEKEKLLAAVAGFGRIQGENG